MSWVWRCRLLLVAGLVLSGAWLLSLDFKAKISTDVLDLLPASVQNPELNLVRNLASQSQARAVMIAVSIPEAPADQLRGLEKELVALLMGSGAFEDALPTRDPTAYQGAAVFLYEHRNELLLPAWLEGKRRDYAASGSREDFGEWVAEQATRDLEAFLSKPEAVAFDELLSRDPLLLMVKAADALKSGLGDTEEQAHVAAVWALQKGDPLSEEGQQSVYRAMAQLEERIHNQYPKSEYRWTGVARFAAESRKRIQQEVSWLNVLSLVAVGLVAGFGVSRLLRVWHLLPAVACGTLGAWAVTTLVFSRTHVLVFVVGALLNGVAIDYSFYIFLQKPDVPGEAYGRKLGRLLSPLLGSALTTVLGFLLLLFSDLPLLKEVGVFVSSGLLVSLAAAMLWFGQVRDPYLAPRRVVEYQAPKSRRAHVVSTGLVLCLVCIGVGGILRLNWKDDVRDLEVPSRKLRDNDQKVRRWLGESNGRTVYLSVAPTLEEARERWAAFRDAAGTLAGGDESLSLGDFLPSRNEVEKMPVTLAELGDFGMKFSAALSRHGFAEAEFKAFDSVWTSAHAPTQIQVSTVFREFIHKLRGPASFLAGYGNDSAWIATVSSVRVTLDTPGTFTASRLETLNDVFASYRKSGVKLGLFGLGLLSASVLVMYGLRRGVLVFLIPVGSTLFAFGFFGWSGISLNLFHLLGAFLGVCLSHNYSIFSTESRLRKQAFPASVRLSAWTTAASFGVLGLSAIPVVSALGSTVALIVLTAWILSESVYCAVNAREG